MTRLTIDVTYDQMEYIVREWLKEHYIIVSDPLFGDDQPKYADAIRTLLEYTEPCDVEYKFGPRLHSLKDYVSPDGGTGDNGVSV